MVAKDSIQAPIDKPLASSFIKGFDGWSTAYPPELAAPTTLRQMENLLVTKDGALKIRPGLRSVFPDDFWLSNQGTGETIVGSFEHFMADAGQKGILFAVRLADQSIRFRTYVLTGGSYVNAPTVFDNASAVLQTLGAVVIPASVTFIKYLQIDNKILALFDDSSVGGVLFKVGTTKEVKKVSPEGLAYPYWTDAPIIIHPNAPWINEVGTTPGTPAALVAEAPTSGANGTLISSIATENTYNFGFYFTVETDFGETPPSAITTVKTQRGWSQWQLNKPDSVGNKSAVLASTPLQAMDQLAAILPYGQSVGGGMTEIDYLWENGAIRWNLYMFTWSDTSAVPSFGTLVAQKEITSHLSNIAEVPTFVQVTSRAPADSWLTPIPSIPDTDVGGSPPVPLGVSRENYSGAPTATQGLVAADRLILVNDANARIAWTAGLVQDYMNFSPSRGGGQKTLSAGNLALPVTAVLWQNPQAMSTLTVLCSGLDGYHTAYYMAPASVSGQSGSTIIMGFEETIATPGTISPYGCEVYRSALYHPLEQGLMKSTANNYSITHTMMSDDIANMWKRLQNKENIVSSQLNDEMYFIVNNPQGIPLPEGCMGNEIWVVNPSKEGTIWSRWLIPAIALRKMELNGILYMSVVTPTAISILDPYSYVDEIEDTGGTTLRVPIPWYFETNTLGANSRADVQVQLQQAEMHFGDWIGKCRWGIRGWNGQGRPKDINKLFQSVQVDPIVPPSDYKMDPNLDLGDTTDTILLKELFTQWTVWASSEGSEVSYGQINMARFRFAQLSVNNGYQLGSVQTFEYARNEATGNNTLTQNGIPRPVQDTRRP